MEQLLEKPWAAADTPAIGEEVNLSDSHDLWAEDWDAEECELDEMEEGGPGDTEEHEPDDAETEEGAQRESAPLPRSTRTRYPLRDTIHPRKL